MTPEERFDELVGEFLDMPGVTGPGSGRGFGSSALRVGNKIFAMLAHERLVVKLPGARVDVLVAAGEGVRFDANKGVPMKEWFSVDPDSALSWQELARESCAFVAGK
ncbi:hypothetical protein AB0E63_03675 [Kribbella sp. NPDC026596]|uniref:hypothetical protein n=1 Tax=Kribbella sp. NPDC026596 TaxID=3155122 RepID=UPI0033C68FF5